MLNITFLLALLLAGAALPHECGADWWDDFVGGVHEKLVAGADFLKEKAGPAIRENFDAAKAKLQDPQTHEEAQSWISENWEKLKRFINEDVAPEAYKIYKAGMDAYEKKKAASSAEEQYSTTESAEAAAMAAAAVKDGEIKARARVAHPLLRDREWYANEQK